MTVILVISRSKNCSRLKSAVIMLNEVRLRTKTLFSHCVYEFMVTSWYRERTVQQYNQTACNKNIIKTMRVNHLSHKLCVTTVTVGYSLLQSVAQFHLLLIYLNQNFTIKCYASIKWHVKRVKWTFQLGKKFHAKNREIYSFFVVKTWFSIATTVVTEFTWCSNPRHTLEGIYQSFSTEVLLWIIDYDSFVDP